MGDLNQKSPSKLELRHQVEELKQRASRDALSGLLNRAAAEYCIKKQLAAMTPVDSCALFIVDLDNFKDINDTLGHQAGDQAIRKSARILSGLFQPKDIVGRLGGDEFVVFLCGRITEKLVRNKGAELCEALQLVLGDRQPITLTASVGIYLSSMAQPFDEMYQYADLALYKAKKAGKHGFWLKYQDPNYGAASSGFHPVNTIPLVGLLEHMGSGVALLEMGDVPQVIYVSPSFCRMIGVQPQAYPLPRLLSELIHPDDLVSLEQALREGLHQGQTVEHIHRVASGDGQWLWWNMRAVEVRYDNPNPVMLVTTTDISQFKEKEHQLEENNQRLQAAFDQTAQHLWEVDIPTKTFRPFGRGGAVRFSEPERTDFPNQLIVSGRVHPNSAAHFRTFAQELLNGQPKGYGNFIIRDPNTGCYRWMALSYRMLFDDVGHAVRAVGLLEDLSKDLLGQGAEHSPHHPLPEGLLSDLSARCRANLTRDTVEDMWIEGNDLSLQAQNASWAHILAMEREKIVHPEDQAQLYALYNREALLQQFRQGRRWLATEYKRTDSSGHIRWVRHAVYLMEEPDSGDICACAYLIRLDLLEQCEQSLGKRVERDPVTGLFPRAVTEQIAAALLRSQGDSLRAVVLLHISGLTDPRKARPAKAELLSCHIAAALSVALGGSCILGQYSPEQILLLFPSVPDMEDLRLQLEEALAFTRRTLAQTTDLTALRFVAGATIREGTCADFHDMLSKAEQVSRQWWHATADTVVFAREDDDWNWQQPRAGKPWDHVSSVRTAERERALSAEEKDVAFRCMSAMLTADSLESSVQGFLAVIGTYYRADRVYILLLEEGRPMVTMPYEWTGPDKRSIQKVVSGMQLDRFPMLERSMEKRTPIFLTRAASGPEAPEGEAGDDAWHFTTFPLLRQEQAVGFLCVENAREHPADAALFSVLIPYLMRERQRFHVASAAAAIGRLTELPNLRSYMDAVNALNSDRYTSLGAVCVDIPRIGTINGSLGFEYGGKMLGYVSKTLADIFGPRLLFRTWESEFVVFCPNTTRPVFLGRCNRLLSILHRRYPREVRIGYTWAKGAFSGKRLAEQARSLLCTDQAGLAPGPVAQPARSHPYRTVDDAARAGRFTIFFQPKVDMRTGALFGAEALVRGIGEDGTIVPPARFIDILEERGGIRELDLLVLEQAFSQMDRWRKAGLGIVPVSVNLSRVTLLHPSTLASILAIQSRFPEIPPDALELEITENAGNIEITRLRELVNRFRACGLQLSLDDFGSQYANLPLFTSVEFSTVKLDRSLIAELEDNPVNRMLIGDIVQICSACGMTCVAEGVETQAQIAVLTEAGCSYGQGYYYGRPMPAKDFEERFLRGRSPTETAQAGEQ